MLRDINKTFASSTEKGSLMIEALAMLGLISMVTPVIYKKAAERTTEMQDVNAASQVRVLVKSVDDYLRDNYNSITNGDTIGGTNYSAFKNDADAQVTLQLNDDELRKYLPIGFQTQGKTFNGFDLAIHQKMTGSKKTLTAVLVAKPTNTDTFNKLRASRVASMVGTNGGYVDGDNAMGVQGVWQIAKDQLPDATVGNNTIVATSLQAIADGTAGGNNVLHRVQIPGRPELNTMETALNMGSQNITQVNSLIAQSSDNTITMEGTGSGNLTLDVDGATNIAKGLQAAITSGGAQFAVDGGSGNTTIKGTTTGHGNLQIGTGGTDNFKVLAGSGNTTIKGTTTGHGDLQIGSGGTDNFKVLAGSGNTTIKGTTTGWGDFQIGSNGTDNVKILAATGNTTIKGTTTGWGDFQIGSNGTDNVKILAATGNTTIKGTTTGWGDFQIGSNGTDNVKILAATGDTTIKGTTTGWGDFQIGSNGADNFTVTASDGSMSAATGNMSVDASGNTTIQGWTEGYDDLTIYNENKEKVLWVDTANAPDIDAGSNGETYIRKGVIMLAHNASSGTTNKASTGYIKADRLVGYKTATDEQGGIYEDYQVNPAYTSMMHDIKLTTRGGARLSDILPDFINKGIYVMDNTYTGDTNWENGSIGSGNILSGLSECSGVKCDTSAWLGFIPTPSCPQNYSQVATITPIRFNMAQAGIPMFDEGLGTWNIGQHHDPRMEKVRPSGTTEADYITRPYVDIITDSTATSGDTSSGTPYAAQMHNLPYNFQINTWLNTTLKAHYTDSSATPSSFKGWHGIMGFIYPGIDYKDYLTQVKGMAESQVKDDTIVWNLFPVYKEELSAIATVYCYFNRKNFDSTLVDHYEAHRQSFNNIRKPHTKDDYDNSNNAYFKRLNDETITDYKLKSKW